MIEGRNIQKTKNTINSWYRRPWLNHSKYHPTGRHLAMEKTPTWISQIRFLTRSNHAHKSEDEENFVLPPLKSLTSKLLRFSDPSRTRTSLFSGYSSLKLDNRRLSSVIVIRRQEETKAASLSLLTTAVRMGVMVIVRCWTTPTLSIISSRIEPRISTAAAVALAQ